MITQVLRGETAHSRGSGQTHAGEYVFYSSGWQEKGRTNQYIDQARRLSVAAGPIAGLSWSVSSGPAYA